jgi:hypothetical protein
MISVASSSVVETGLASADAWLTAHADLFVPFEEHDPARFDFRLKAFAELCLYLYLAKEIGVAVTPSLQRSAATFAASKTFLTRALRSPSDTLAHAFGFLALEGDLRQALARHHKSVRDACNDETEPCEQLARVWIAEALGTYGTRDGAREADALALSALARPGSGLSPSPLAAYCLTHSAFFATRFGRRRLDLAADRMQMLAATTLIALCRAFAARDYDAAFELVLARMCVGIAYGPQDAVIVESCLALLDTGFPVPPPTAGVFATGSREAEWGCRYHTMIVAGLLLLQRLAEHASDTPPANDATALAMDVIGSAYTAAAKGDPATAICLLSRLGELPPSERPPAAWIAPLANYLGSLFRTLTATNTDMPGCSELAGELHAIAAEFDQASG